MKIVSKLPVTGYRCAMLPHIFDNGCRIRKEKGRTQEMLSGLFGLSQQYLSDLERGKRNPTIVTIYELRGRLAWGIELVTLR